MYNLEILVSELLLDFTTIIFTDKVFVSTIIWGNVLR